jgi:hypothetical protein
VDLTVACVLRSGGAYRAEHVAGIAAQVAHFLPGARMVCLSDVPVPCERIALETDWPGWWAKLSLFDHFKGRTLYLDLDTVIVKDPMPLVTGAFTMIRNWVYPHLFASGVMSWDGDYSHITRAFEESPQEVMDSHTTLERWGDQAFIAEHAGDVQGFPAGAVASYRYQMARRRLTRVPYGARIVAFNGTHLPWQCGPSWARRWWAPKDEQVAA